MFVTCCALCIPRDSNAGDWPYSQFDMGASARSEAAGIISAQQAQLPTQSSLLTVDELALGDVILLDMDGDTISDVITCNRGRIAAFRSDGTMLWSTPLLQATQLHGIHDLDGDGTMAELVAVAKDLAGGIFVVNAYTGGLLWQYGPLTDRSGVQVAEVAVYDVDDDGAEELFFAENSYGNDGYYAVDFSNGIGAGEVATSILPASYANYTPSVAANFLDAGAAVITQQSVDMGVLLACDPQDVGASCSPTEAICLCDMGVFEDVHQGFSYGPAWAHDLDGDGLDELIQIHDSTQFGAQIAILDINEGLSTGVPNTEDLFVWTYDYGHDDPVTAILLPQETLEDLDGDGDLDLLVVFYNNLSEEVDQDGDPVDDGVHFADAFASAVFDVGSGDLVVAMENTVAWGTGDFDNDGVTEIVTSSTSNWSYLAGIEAYVVECDPTCAAVEVWQDSTHTLLPDIDLMDNVSFPDLELLTMDAGGDGDPELLAWNGDNLELLEIAGGGNVQVSSTIALLDDEVVQAVDEDGSYALLYSQVDTRLLDTELWVMATSVVSYGQAVAEVLAVQFDPADPRAYLVVNGAVYLGLQLPQSTDDASLITQPHVLFAEDLTGDGYPELVSWAQPEESDDGYLVVDTYSFDPADPDGDGTPFGLLWSFRGSTENLLAGYGLRNTAGHQSRPADLDGDGDPDVVFGLFGGAEYSSAVLALDGQSGTLLDFYEVSYLGATRRFCPDIPFMVYDRYGADGTPGADGLDDLTVSDGYGLMTVPGGSTQVASSFETSRVNWEGAYADLDGDGQIEAVLLSGTAVTPTITAVTAIPGFPEFWDGDADLAGLENSSSESVAIIEMDTDSHLDIAYVSGSGSVEIREGETGGLAAGYPIHLRDGEVLEEEDPESTPLNAAATFDSDGDGYEELIIGGDDGWVYALNVHVDDGGPTLEWTYYVGNPIHALRVADVDGDTHDEVLVVGMDSTVRTLDSLGIYLKIEEPGDGDCLHELEFTVSGTADGVHTVDVLVAGVQSVPNVPIDNNTWEADGAVAPGVGIWEVKAIGMDIDGMELAYDSIEVAVDGDADGDGWTVCGGDCDDTDPTLNYDDADGDGWSTCDGDCVDDDLTLNLDDLDGDGWTTCAGDCDDVDDALNLTDEDGDTYSTCDGDCNDNDDTIYPGAPDESSDGIDSDCDGDHLEGGGCECSTSASPKTPLGWLLLLSSALFLARRSTIHR